ncbi:MAG: OmpA family protein [Pasteurella sp.]|nr:OmpA family protein [Pasteurella sp.]
MKNLKKLLLVGACGLSISACTSLVSTNVVDDQGNPLGELKWPDMDDATQPEGTFPNQAEIDLIQKNLSHLQLKKIFEHPHFQERFRAREWNYIFNFNMSDGSIKQCQFKVLFDSERRGQNYYWKPADCLSEKFDLSTDMLFEFDKSGLPDVREQGKEKLNQIADYIIREGNKAQLTLVGHTDYLGSDAYNMALSKRRAETIKQYMVNRGVNGYNITTKGAGETQPIKQCDKNLERSALKECLITNRRVSVEIKRYGKGKVVWHDINMPYSVMENASVKDTEQ